MFGATDERFILGGLRIAIALKRSDSTQQTLMNTDNE